MDMEFLIMSFTLGRCDFQCKNVKKDEIVYSYADYTTIQEKIKQIIQLYFLHIRS